MFCGRDNYIRLMMGDNSIVISATGHLVTYLMKNNFLLNNFHILEECNVPYIRYSLDKHKVDRYGQNLLESLGNIL